MSKISIRKFTQGVTFYCFLIFLFVYRKKKFLFPITKLKLKIKLKLEPESTKPPKLDKIT